MFFFVPLYLFVVLNSVQGVENNETLKIENSDSTANSNSSLSGNIDRNSTFPKDNLNDNSNDWHSKVNSNLTVNEISLNSSQSQKIERKVERTEKTNEHQPSQSIDEQRPFEPSPTLGTVLEYEYNKVPVKPVFPEPRLRFPTPSTEDSPWIARDNTWRASENVAQVSQHQKPDIKGTVEEVKPEPKYVSTTAAGTTALLGTTWNNKNHFPTQPSIARPYQFYNHPGFSSSGPTSYDTGTSSGTGHYSFDKGPNDFGLGPSSNGIGPSGYGLTPTSHKIHDGFSFNRPVEVPKRPQWNHHNGQKTQLDCCPEEKPIREKTHYGDGYDGLSYYGYSPWKKILKVLATIIPLGILISALTPSVIQITNVNDTQTATGESFSRYRSADTSKKEIADHLLSSLQYIEELNQNGCEYRVFCELLLSAKNTKNSKKNVDELLNSFSERNFDVKSRKKELKRVFDAVRMHDCASIPCELI